jgi:hypothetical protein
MLCRLAGLEGWRFGGLEGWKVGGLEGCRVVGLEGWRVGVELLAASRHNMYKMYQLLYKQCLLNMRKYFSKYVESINRNKLKANRVSCWSYYPIPIINNSDQIFEDSLLI